MPSVQTLLSNFAANYGGTQTTNYQLLSKVLNNDPFLANALANNSAVTAIVPLTTTSNVGAQFSNGQLQIPVDSSGNFKTTDPATMA